MWKSLLLSGNECIIVTILSAHTYIYKTKWIFVKWIENFEIGWILMHLYIINSYFEIKVKYSITNFS